MTTYLKDKNMNFRLKDLESRPDFSIWKSWDKRAEEFKDGSGTPMKFPIRDGVLTNDKGEVKEVADIKFMPNKDFKEQYSRYARKFNTIRQIYVNGVEYSYRFGAGANSKLQEKIAEAKLIGKDVLKMEFAQVFDKTKSPVDMYSLKLIAVDLPEVVVVQPESIPTYSSKVSKEQEIVEAIKSVYGKEATQERFIDIMKKNDITEAKAIELYQEYKK